MVGEILTTRISDFLPQCNIDMNISSGSSELHGNTESNSFTKISHEERISMADDSQFKHDYNVVNTTTPSSRIDTGNHQKECTHATYKTDVSQNAPIDHELDKEGLPVTKLNHRISEQRRVQNANGTIDRLICILGNVFLRRVKKIIKPYIDMINQRTSIVTSLFIITGIFPGPFESMTRQLSRRTVASFGMLLYLLRLTRLEACIGNILKKCILALHKCLKFLECKIMKTEQKIEEKMTR